ncbi:MAG: alpha amylase C-terminal domain-containing protein, partial [Rubrobacter sp.]|nr:alpha amylase C-terminal domain-containing protein [Rubrobacter sp.]
HEVDFEPDGFEWLGGGDRQNSVVSFMRRAKDPEDFVVVVSNFTPVVHEGYRVGVPDGGRYEEILNTDEARYGGSGVGNGSTEAEEIPAHGKSHSITLTLPPLATMILKKASGT